MVKEFRITDKPLQKARPLVVQMLLDNGGIRWYENVKSGALLNVYTGEQKAMINIDQKKIINFNSDNSIKDKSVGRFIRDHVYIDPNKIQNLGEKNKPIYGVVCHEKDFNPYPHDPLHDSREVTNWLDTIIKNYKNFTAQKLEGWGKILLYGGLAAALILFIIYKYAPEPTPEAAKTVTQVGAMIPLLWRNPNVWRKET